MKCPACKDVQLLMADRQGIEVDYCPTCRGVWLDRGELDRLIDRAMETGPRTGHAAPPTHRQADHRPADHRPYRDEDYRQRRRKSFLGELLDFD